jgi:hypothetical protein
MARVSLNLEDRQDLAVLGTTGWRIAPGLVPGEPNQGLVAELRASPARLPDYDDSWWEKDADVQERRSIGFTFAWYRLHVTVPSRVKGVDVSGRRMWFETNIDNYGEIYVDGKIDRVRGVITGNSVARRVEVGDSAVPGTRHVIAVLGANGPLAEPGGTVFMRYADLAFE